LTFYDCQAGENFESDVTARAWMDLCDTDLNGKIERMEMFRALVRQQVKQQEAEP